MIIDHRGKKGQVHNWYYGSEYITLEFVDDEGDDDEVVIYKSDVIDWCLSEHVTDFESLFNIAGVIVKDSAEDEVWTGYQLMERAICHV